MPGPSETHGWSALPSVRPFAVCWLVPAPVRFLSLPCRRCLQLIRPLLTSRSAASRRPFGRKARSPQVRVMDFPAQSLDLRRLPLIARASRSHVRWPWLASPHIHRARSRLWSARFLFVGSRFRSPLLSAPASRPDRVIPGFFALRFDRGRCDRLPQRTSTSYPCPCWAHTLPGPRPGASWSKLRFSLPPPLANTSPEKLRLDGAEFALHLVGLDVSTNGLRSHSFADGSDEVARTPHFA